MYATSPSDVRFDVVTRLQALTTCSDPGSHRFDVADHAITLALNPSRAVSSKAYLFRNVWRDSARSLRRSAGRRGELLDPLTEATSLGQEIADGGIPGAAHTETPEALVSTGQLAQSIRRAVSQLDRHGVRCFDAMLAGEPLEETAAALGVSPLRVKRLRARIRAAARRLAYAEAA